MKGLYNKINFLFLLLLGTSATFGQAHISGPTCVVAGTIYQYTIGGSWDTASMQICITGGVLADSTNTTKCSPTGTVLSKVLVVWNDSAMDDGSLSLTSSSGGASLNVHFTEPLLPGTIDSAVRTQMLGYNVVPSPITCSQDSGGSCSPNYAYQWQFSSNAVAWADISGATGTILQIDSALTQSTFYRRKVMETTSGSVGYSDLATVFVIIQLTDSTVSDSSSSFNNYNLKFHRSLNAGDKSLQWRTMYLPDKVFVTGSEKSYAFFFKTPKYKILNC